MLLTCLACLACLVPAGCARQPGPAMRPQHTSVDVDTPSLRALKARAGVEPCRRGAASPAAHGLPDLTLPCLGGGPPVALSGLRGPLVVNLFAQWCGPCRTELPFYQELHRRAKGTVQVLGVDYLDEQPAGALEVARAAGVTYPLLADPSGRLRPELRVRGLPGVVLVDRSGAVVDVEFRVFRSYAELRQLVQHRLGVSLSA